MANGRGRGFILLASLIMLLAVPAHAHDDATAAVSVIKTASVQSAGATTMVEVSSPLVLAAAGEYRGNVKSGIFHRPGCRYYNCKNCTAVFHSRKAAMGAGFRPCKVCKP